MSDRRRLLNDLRVIDLRAELEKRNLDKSGVRGVLIQRLSKHILEEEGEDPATYRFDQPNGAESKSPTKKTRRSESAVEADSTEETPAMEDMIVQDDAGDEEESEQQAALEGDADALQIESEQVAASPADAGRKRDMLDDSDATQPKKPCLLEDQDHKNENNTDADDSINLDLGEDELLNEETDSTSKAKMDEASEEPTETAGEDSAAGTDSAAAGDQQVQKEDDAAAISNDRENNDNEKADKSKDGDSDKSNKKDGDPKETGARNLWVSGLSGDTRAKDLKQLCSKHGKVIGAKVVTNARTPGSRCYGYVTMSSAQDAEDCIKNLHRSELHGRMISVEKAKSEAESSARRQPTQPERRSTDHKDDGKDEDKNGASGDKARKDDEGGLGSDSRTREKTNRTDKDRPKRSTRSRERRRSPQRDMLSFNRIWKERDVARARERSRAVREEDRRRRAAEEALRERERRQRQERQRLALEKEKLRAEREKIEREKNVLLRLERERHRLEREKLELERLELKRAQLRLEEERRKRTYDSAYRKPAQSPPPEPAYDRERHKRAPPPPMSANRGGQFEAPPPPRFEIAAGYERGADKRDRDYKRDYPRHASGGNVKYPSNGNSNEDARQPIPPGNRPKEPGRSYESRDSRPYRPSPPGKPEARNWSGSSRYPDSAANSKGTGGSEAWSGGEPRYGSGGPAYESRYQPAYQPPPPGAAYPDRYAQPTREYRKY